MHMRSANIEKLCLGRWCPQELVEPTQGVSGHKCQTLKQRKRSRCHIVIAPLQQFRLGMQQL